MHSASHLKKEARFQLTNGLSSRPHSDRILSNGANHFHIVNVFRNDRVDKDKQILWTILLFMGTHCDADLLVFRSGVRARTVICPTDPRALKMPGSRLDERFDRKGIRTTVWSATRTPNWRE